jgi:predicted DCC family thiol-disulfide oxidoreductase YuxK
MKDDNLMREARKKLSCTEYSIFQRAYRVYHRENAVIEPDFAHEWQAFKILRAMPFWVRRFCIAVVQDKLLTIVEEIR